MNSPGKSASRHWLPLGVLAAGALVLGVLLGARWLHLRSQAEDAAWVEAVSTVEADVAISHLWLEEYVSGDDVDLGEIDLRLDRADRLVDELLGDDSVQEGLRQEVLRMGASLDQFCQIAEDRRLGLERGLPVGIGSSFDVEYDAVFARLLGHVRVLKAALVENREAGRQREARGAWIFGTAWMALILIASAGLWRYGERRRLAEQALDEHRRQLRRVQRTEAVGNLAGGLAHDLGNYLAAIRAQCELLLRKAAKSDTVPSEQAEAKMTTVLGVVDKASALLDRLLAFHRGARIDHLETLDLNEAVRGLENMVTAALGSAIELRLDLAEELWPVAADPPGLEQAIINLVVNARDAMDAKSAGGGRVTIQTMNRPASGLGGDDRVRLVVADRGIGIEPEALERVFDPFWSTKGQSGRHSGLGLAIVDSVVHRMDGTVSVVSRLGRGTAFRIDLPRKV